MPRVSFPYVNDSIVHDKPSSTINFLPKHIHDLPKNNMSSSLKTRVQNKLPDDVLAEIVITYIGRKDDRTFNILFEGHFVKINVDTIVLKWGRYNGVLYRDVSLKGVVLKYWHNRNRIPISSLTSVVSSHTFTTVVVHQRIDKQDTGGHRGSCMGHFSGMYCPYTGRKVRLPHITD